MPKKIRTTTEAPSLKDVLAKAKAARDEWLADFDHNVLDGIDNTLRTIFRKAIYEELGIEWDAWHQARIDLYRGRNEHTPNLYNHIKESANVVADKFMKLTVGEIVLSQEEIDGLKETARRKYMECLKDRVIDLAAEKGRRDAIDFLAGELEFDQASTDLEEAVEMALHQARERDW